MMLTLRAGAEDTSPKSTDAKPLPSIMQETAGTQAMPGFFACAWDTGEGKHSLRIGRFDTYFFLRDEGPRDDPELSLRCYGMAVDLLRRELGTGDEATAT